MKNHKTKSFVFIFCFFIICIFVNGLFFQNLNSFTNKTYLRPFDSFVYLPVQEKFSEFIIKEFKELDIYSKLSLSLFYFQSTKGSKIGRYFGTNEKNNVVISDRNSSMDVYHDYLVHRGGTPGGRIANVSFNPKTTYFGAVVSFLYDFSKILKNFYFKINVPINTVKNNIAMGFSSQGYDNDEDSQMIKKYLEGTYNDLTNQANLQDYLTHAKICGSKSKSGISDLNFILGYRILDKKNEDSVFKLGLIVPLGNKAKGEYLFEPILGNGNHWAVNIGFDGYFRILDHENSDLNFVFDLDYKYLFENTQKRTLSIKGANWGQYYLLGKKSSATNVPLTPAANVLTRDVLVSPGSLINCDIKLLLNYKKFCFDLGYGFLFREAESVKLKDSFPQDTYAVAEATFDTQNAFDRDDTYAAFNDYWLSDKSIDIQAAQTPYQLSHKIYVHTVYQQI